MIPTCDLYDAHGEAVGVLPAGLRNFGGRQTFHGPAATVKTFEDNSRIRELAASPGLGRVMVIDGGGAMRCALVGDQTAADALANGWAGFVVWGAVRDSAALAVIPVGVMAMGTIPRRPDRAGAGMAGVPVFPGGVRVAEGDLIVADADGVLVFPAGGPLPDPG